MREIFNLPEEQWKKLGGYITAEEIHHQPRLWKETLQLIKSKKSEIKKFIDNILEDDTRIIFTGAGTSAYVGDTVAPYLRKLLGKRIEAIATTDILSNPEAYLEKDVKTILVSCARSGNSPESVGVCEVIEKCVDNVKHLVITCNKDGKLAAKAKENNKNLLILLPQETNDKGFAMTNSFTCMVMTSLLIFDLDNFDENEKKVEKLIESGQAILDTKVNEVQKVVDEKYKRLIFLGSSSLKGLAEEAALKNLELTSGKLVALSEGILGFRHGPKSIINDQTAVFMFISMDKYTRKYDMDLLREMSSQKNKEKIIVITHSKDEEIEKLADYVFTLEDGMEFYKADAYSALAYILIPQMFAILSSIQNKVSPDNPRPDGSVNRVVKGVTVYKYQK